MSEFNQNKKELINKGYSVTEPIFGDEECLQLISLIESSQKRYAIRQLVNKLPKIEEVVFQNEKFKKLYTSICSTDYFLSKAIFFNKIGKFNWFVSHHQDLSISVKKNVAIDGYSNWTNKNGQLGVIPPQEILEKVITFRIHLDKTDELNGALKVILGSHKKGIIRIDENFKKENTGKEELCAVKQGGVMLMKPLILHASSKSLTNQDRRVIHLEFCNQEIPMEWLERKDII